ncbi:DUF4235 domain-containing protein [Actinoplanes aureus]|jgi:hypothetical protein|uniref:DUF4235 domain-containing protein n=1 Tax=Actinoplanes aureus TaxID=2792083 RepID=A0A931CNT2_9ACTN|nr:DUF4235 domain-containing protein [Actinoplanes aureus]MBG0568300.1 DUF4235 domain-containing protein [Actinoplanes aureus]
MAGKLGKLALKPVNVGLGLAAGAVAGILFKEAWKLVSGDDDAPDAGDPDRGWVEILTAAALQGAIFAVVKAAVHRGGAIGTHKLTGTWPD